MPFVLLVKVSFSSGKTSHRTNTTSNRMVLGGQGRQQLQYSMHVQSIKSIALGCKKANLLQPYRLLNRLWIPHTNIILWAGLGTGKKEKQERVSESNFKFLFKIRL